jgi:hypothetical protein
MNGRMPGGPPARRLCVRGREGRRRRVGFADRSEAEPESTRPAKRGTPKGKMPLGNSEPRKIATRPPEMEFENGADFRGHFSKIRRENQKPVPKSVPKHVSITSRNQMT